MSNIHYITQFLWVSANIVWAFGELYNYAIFHIVNDDMDQPWEPDST